jgi:hypothetical protein
MVTRRLQARSAQPEFALVRALETDPKPVVRGRVEVPTFRFSGWQTTTFEQAPQHYSA